MNALEHSTATHVAPPERPSAIRLEKILVPTDFSEASKQALPYAVSLADQFGADITLVHVVPETLPASISHIGIVLEEKRLIAAAGKALAQFREKEIPANLKVETLVLAGSPYYKL